MSSTPRFLQGVAEYVGAGFSEPVALPATMTYRVPEGARAQALYFRGGNSGDSLAVVVLQRDGAAMRYFPVGARGGVHVSLRVVEDVEAGSEISMGVLAPDGAAGTVVVDLGLVEV